LSLIFTTQEMPCKHTNRSYFMCLSVFFVNRWSSLLQASNHIDDVLNRKEAGQPANLKRHIGGGWYAWITNAGRLVDIRLFSMARGSRRPVPGPVGITLRHGEWLMLKNHVRTIIQHHPLLASAIPCWMDPAHLSDIFCTECHPYSLL